ncbi:MAG: ABC transporter ATP-binding protein [Deltaproteobacteria bacterium]|nr:ABC transporter ATP-binding protein [Deltaproteobacteria bacterium]
MRALRLVLKNLDQFRTSFYLIFLVGSLSAATSFLIPVLLAEFTKSAFSMERFIDLSIWIVVLYYVTMPLQWCLRKYGEALGPKFAIHLRIKYFRQLAGQSTAQLLQHHSGYAFSLIGTVADGLGHLSVEILWGLTYIITNLSLFFYFTAKESLAVAIVNLVLMIVFVCISTLLAQKIVPIISSLNTTRASLLERYVDFTANVLTVKRLGIASFAEHQLQQQTELTYERIQAMQNFHAKRWLLLHSLFGLAYMSTIIYMLWQVSLQQASPAILILFVASYGTVKGNVERLSENLKLLIEMNASVQNLEEILPEESEPMHPVPRRAWNHIEMRDVQFAYSSDSALISIPQFILRSGEKICISGPSGEGKTTILNLLAGLYQPIRGELTVDQTKIDATFQQHMAFVSQEAELFNVSLYENLSLGRSISRQEIERYMEELDLLSWLQRLEKGLDAKIGERGLRVSAGQRQRLNLLRGILLDRDIYLLDEPTSHLDRKTEQRVIEFLGRHLQSKSVIIVSHREALKTLCNRAYFMENHTLQGG